MRNRPGWAGQAGLPGRGVELRAARLAADFLATTSAFAVAYRAYVLAITSGWHDQAFPQPGPYVALAAVFSLITLLVFAHQGLYRGRATVLNLWELETAVKGVVLSAALLFAILFLLKLQAYSRYVVVGAVGLAIVFVVLERRTLAAVVRRFQLRAAFGRRTLIYGCERTGQLLMKKILESPHLGATVVGFLDDHVPLGSYACCRVTQTDPKFFRAPVLGRLEDLPRIVARHGVDDLLLAESTLTGERQREVVLLCAKLGLDVGVVPSLGDVRSDQLRVEDLSAIPVLRPIHPVSRKIGGGVKRAFDLVAGVLLLVATAPLWALTAMVVRLEDAGPLLFRQQRIGQNGKPFMVYKFRTMRGDAPPYASSPPGDRDPNITRVGRILRKSGFDELPQLLNVLRGEMSLVGPRPEMPHLVQRYTTLERQRLRVRPGITGLWQLSADRCGEIHENIEYDLYYVNHQTFLLDLLVLLETVFFTFGVLVGLLDRSSPVGSSAAASRESLGGLPAVDEEYVLVALDQRRNGVLPAHWRTCLPAAYEISDRWPVRIVLAHGNRPALEGVLEQAAARLGRDGRRTSFAPYRTRSDLRRLVDGARLVITDLEHVIDWTEETGVDLLSVEDGGVRWWPRSRVPDPIVAELSRILTVLVGSARKEVAGGGERPEVKVIPLTGS